MRRSGLSVLMAVLLLYAFSAIAWAQGQQPQQPQTQKQSSETKKKVPALSTEDVIGDRSAPTTVEETGDKSAKPEEGAAHKKVSADEAAWREQVKQARTKAESLQRQAEEAEVSVTRLRNQLSAAGQTPGDRNQILQEIEDAGQNVTSLRQQTKDAKDELDRVLAEGGGKGYTESAGPEPTKDGAPNEDYFRSKYAELLQKVQDAQRQTELYDDRVKELTTQINQAGGKGRGDNFYIAKVQQDLAEARQSLSDAQDAVAKAQQAIEALKDEARQAGVPPGVFREAGQ